MPAPRLAASWCQPVPLFGTAGRWNGAKMTYFVIMFSLNGEDFPAETGYFQLHLPFYLTKLHLFFIEF